MPVKVDQCGQKCEQSIGEGGPTGIVSSKPAGLYETVSRQNTIQRKKRVQVEIWPVDDMLALLGPSTHIKNEKCGWAVVVMTFNPRPLEAEPGGFL